MDKKGIFQSKLWRKIIVACLLIGMIPAIVVGAFSSSRAVGIVQEKVRQRNMTQLDQVRLSVEMQLSMVEKIMLQLVDSPLVQGDINTPFLGTNFEKFNEIETAIGSLPSMGFAVRDISLINLREDWVVDTMGAYSLADYENENGSIEPYEKVDRYSYWMDALMMKKLDPNASQQTYITLVRRYVESQNDCIATMDIPYSSFHNQISSPGSSCRLYVLSSNGCTIYSDNGAQLGKDMSSSPVIRRINSTGKSRGSFQMNVDHVVSVVDYIKSDEYEWYYIMVTPLSSLQSDSRAIGLFTTTVFLIVLLVLVVFSLFISTRAYRPIMTLYKAVVRTNDSGTGGKKDELQMIEQTIGAMVTDRKNLQSEIVAQSDYLKQYFSIKLLQSHNDREAICSRTELYQLPQQTPRMAILIIRVDSLDQTSYANEDEDLLLYAINNIMGELFESQTVSTPALMEDQQVTILSVADGADYRNEIYAAALKLQTIVKEQLSFTVSVFVSRELHDYCDIHGRYLECLETMQYHMMPCEDTILFIGDLDDNIGKRPIYPEEKEKEIFDAIKSCDQVKCVEMLHQFIDDVFNIESNRSECKIFLTKLADGLIILMEETGHILRPSTIHRSINQLKSRDEIEKWFTDMADSVMESIRNLKSDHFHKICDQMIHIIKTDFDKKLTLEDCAAQLNYHPNYLRRIFDEKYGTSFSNYLLQYRIQVSKKWLIETDMKISAIAEKLSYQNTSNFIRSFKKITGATPAQYRNQSKYTQG